jgi:hypothetical protein
MACHPSGDHIFCGKENGVVALYAAQTGQELKILYNHAQAARIHALHCGMKSDLIVSADLTRSVMVWRVIQSGNDLSVRGPLLDVHLDDFQSVDQILLDSTSKRLLVSDPGQARLYDIENGNFLTLSVVESSLGKWIYHPRNPNRLIHITRSILYHRNVLSPDYYSKTRLKDVLEVNSKMVVRSVDTCCDGTKLFVELVSPTDLESTCQVRILTATSLEEVDVTTTEKISGQAVEEMEHIIGSFGNLLLFLNQRMWVCSIDLEESNAKCYRHFFIPDGWLGATEPHAILQVTSKGDLVFVKGDEIAVIENGLNHKEVITVGDTWGARSVQVN